MKTKPNLKDYMQVLIMILTKMYYFIQYLNQLFMENWIEYITLMYNSIKKANKWKIQNVTG